MKQYIHFKSVRSALAPILLADACESAATLDSPNLIRVGGDFRDGMSRTIFLGASACCFEFIYLYER